MLTSVIGEFVCVCGVVGFFEDEFVCFGLVHWVLFSMIDVFVCGVGFDEFCLLREDVCMYVYWVVVCNVVLDDR